MGIDHSQEMCCIHVRGSFILKTEAAVSHEAFYVDHAPNYSVSELIIPLFNGDKQCNELHLCYLLVLRTEISSSRASRLYREI
jgi:hypothetical protein